MFWGLLSCLLLRGREIISIKEIEGIGLKCQNEIQQFCFHQFNGLSADIHVMKITKVMRLTKNNYVDNGALASIHLRSYIGRELFDSINIEIASLGQLLNDKNNYPQAHVHFLEFALEERKTGKRKFLLSVCLSVQKFW